MLKSSIFLRLKYTSKLKAIIAKFYRSNRSSTLRARTRSSAETSPRRKHCTSSEKSSMFISPNTSSCPSGAMDTGWCRGISPSKLSILRLDGSSGSAALSSLVCGASAVSVTSGISGTSCILVIPVSLSLIGISVRLLVSVSSVCFGFICGC